MDAYEAALKLIDMKKRYDANGLIRVKMLKIPQRVRDEYLDVIGLVSLNTLRFLQRPDRYDENEKGAQILLDSIRILALTDPDWLHREFPQLTHQDWLDSTTICHLMWASLRWLNALSIGDIRTRRESEVEFLCAWHRCHVMECRKLAIQSMPPPRRVSDYEYGINAVIEDHLVQELGLDHIEEMEQLLHRFINLHKEGLLLPEQAYILEANIDVFNALFPNRAVLYRFSVN